MTVSITVRGQIPSPERLIAGSAGCRGLSSLLEVVEHRAQSAVAESLSVRQAAVAVQFAMRIGPPDGCAYEALLEARDKVGHGAQAVP
ncbi:MAG: hypothetical protein ACLP8X_13385 [Streptosporangiaceae bacterium]